MAPSTFDIVVLSSSPPEHARPSPSAAQSPPSTYKQRVAMPPSSPLQLSPRAGPQISTVGALRSGSKAAPIPEGARRGFATARSLVAADAEELDDEELPEFNWGPADAGTGVGNDNNKDETYPSNESGSGVKGVVAAGRDAGGDAEVPKPKSKTRARTASKPTTRKKAPTASSHFANPTPTIETAETSDPAPKAKTTKPRKPRAKKAPAPTVEGETQTTIKKAKITKPRASRATKAGKRAKSTHLGGATGEVLPKDAAEAPKQQLDDQPLDIDKAIMRRRDWTPTRDVESLHGHNDSAGKENESAVAVSEKGSFTSLLSNYAYEHMDTTSDMRPSGNRDSDGTVVMKRRRIELVDVPANQVASRQSSPEKGKAPKKKPRTITDLVTEKYAVPPAALETGAAVTSGFFTPRTTATTTTKVPLNDTFDTTNAKSSKKSSLRKRSTSRSASEKEANGKPKLKKASAKTAAKPKLVAEKLLSPASALLRLNTQDVLFGTSSQLALDESPTLVRQIQQAMRESETEADLQQVLRVDIPAWPRLQKARGGRSLWAASARDESGATLERQDVYLPEPDRTQDLPLLMDGLMDEDGLPSANNNASTSVPKHASAPILISSDLPTPPLPVVEEVTNVLHDTNKTIFAELDDYLEEPPPSNQHVASTLLDDDFPLSAQLSPELPQSYQPTIDLRSTSSGSPKKKLGRPPKPRSAIASHLSASVPPIPKKPPAKAKPSSTAPPATPKRKDRFVEIEEILDSEDDTALSPTPPRLRRAESSPLQFTTKAIPPATSDDLVPVFRIPESHLQFANIKSTLFARITTLVRSLPPTTNPTKPSWLERILMYDAIVLEDFTAFLNAHDMYSWKKATRKQIKAWNKQLKCNGEELVEVKDGEDMVIATHKELETWMVRDWCEQMSICCVHREGRGRGGVRKGLY